MKVYLEFSESQKKLLKELNLHTNADNTYELALLESWEDILYDWMGDHANDFAEDTVPKKSLEMEVLYSYVNDFIAKFDD